MDNEEIAYIRDYVTQGIRMAQQAVFIASLQETPEYDSDFPDEHLERLIGEMQDADALCILKDAYEAAYPRFQAVLIAVKALAEPDIAFRIDETHRDIDPGVLVINRHEGLSGSLDRIRNGEMS